MTKYAFSTSRCSPHSCAIRKYKFILLENPSSHFQSYLTCWSLCDVQVRCHSSLSSRGIRTKLWLTATIEEFCRSVCHGKVLLSSWTERLHSMFVREEIALFVYSSVHLLRGANSGPTSSTLCPVLHCPVLSCLASLVFKQAYQLASRLEPTTHPSIISQTTRGAPPDPHSPWSGGAPYEG